MPELHDTGRPHTGRFSFDDTAKKWFVRLCVAWFLFCIAAAVLLAAGVWAVAT